MQIELEKTYLLKYIPQDLQTFPFEEYLDIYIPTESFHPNLRIRKRDAKYEITKKSPLTNYDYSKQEEQTIPLTNEEFEEFASSLKGKRAIKQRFFYVYKGLTGEIDVYKNELKGLILADFEFKTEEEKSKFTMPEFCLAEVTQDIALAGGMLVGKKYREIEPILAKYEYKPLFLNK